MTRATFRVSVLDQSPVSEGMTGAEALRNSVDLASAAESFGYHRYWVAEHHGTPMLASTSPQALIGPVAAHTKLIRVGSGGVMLPHYSPLSVAESFSVLSGLFPGRIDLAVGRAAGTDPFTAFVLQRDRRQPPPDDFPDQLNELLVYVGSGVPTDRGRARLARLPGLPERPEVWLLGSSAQSAVWAAERGLPYAFADFINPSGAALTAHYRETFAKRGARSTPSVMVAVWALAAETDSAAQRLASSARMAFSLFLQGELIRIPTMERAEAFLADRPALREALEQRRRWLIGTPDRVRAAMEDIVRAYQADEVMIVTITHDHADRRRSYELLARAFGISNRD